MRATVFVGLSMLALQVGCVRHAVRPAEPGQDWGEDAPAGMVDVHLVSGDDHLPWDVYAGRQKLCTTPCLRRLSAQQPLILESAEGDVVRVHELGIDAERARRAILVADPTHAGKHVNGIVFTTFGGMGVVTGITLTAVGCSDVESRGGMCTAGLITGGVAIPLTAAAIWMIVDSLPRAHVLPVFRPRDSRGAVPASLDITPGGIAGTF